MTSISQLSNWQPVAARLPSGVPAKAAQPAGPALPPTPSSVVKLSPESLAASKSGAAGGAASGLPAAYRFMGVGASMLNGFKSGAAIPTEPPADLPGTVDNKFALSITTTSGLRVELTLASLDDGMAVQLSASGDLSEAERRALSALAEGFQAAIDGMMKDKPQVRLAALAQFDTAQLKSVDLRAAVKRDTLPPSSSTIDFHADAAHRKVSLDGASGKVEVKVDTSRLASLGNQDQQARAITGYLKQFDQAAGRGHADAELMAMFKDAFADLNRSSRKEAPADKGLSLPRQWTLAQEDQAVLTGLGDFSAAIEQTPKFSNPLRKLEKDSFNYAVSQSTSVEGARSEDRQVSQQQRSRLTAQFHLGSDGDDQLALDLTPESQTYGYHQISDEASSNVELGYRDGRLIKARLEQRASQSDSVMDYVKGKLMAQRTTPAEQTLVVDLLASLALYQTGEDSKAGEASQQQRDARRQATLAAVSEGILLLGSASDLAQRRNQLV
ncbi:hypothetical protein HSX11_10740 [Oxalobacteraceae bacterium]|nr:hypothetical protein [Oxalobacteraceae bacterium]